MIGVADEQSVCTVPLAEQSTFPNNYDNSVVELVFFGRLRILIHPFSLLLALKLSVRIFARNIFTSTFSCRHPCAISSLLTTSFLDRIMAIVTVSSPIPTGCPHNNHPFFNPQTIPILAVSSAMTIVLRWCLSTTHVAS